jgi:S-methylmethionine-dependent homocysteine/selenocysteine methylase
MYILIHLFSCFSFSLEMPSPTSLPHENLDTLFLTDSGVETTFIFLDKLKLREFAAFELLNTEKGRNHLRSYYRRHVVVTRNEPSDDDTAPPLGFVLESVTYRASPDWLHKLGYTPNQWQEIYDRSISLMKEIQDEFPSVPMVTSGNIGPRYDGYVLGRTTMTIEESRDYHSPQVRAFQIAGANMVTAVTLNSMNEGIGIVKAAQQVGIPIVLPFTVETKGCLISGETLQEVIETVDNATDQGPTYYMINCAHPTHFVPFLKSCPSSPSSFLSRIGGVRANASRKSHAELDESDELDDGNPEEFGSEYRELLDLLPRVNVFGGCCGTDHRHVYQIKCSCAQAFSKRYVATVD